MQWITHGMSRERDRRRQSRGGWILVNISALESNGAGLDPSQQISLCCLIGQGVCTAVIEIK